VFLSIVLLAITLPSAARPQGQKPLAKDEIMGLVKAGMDNAQLAKAVRQRGIDFEPSVEYLEALRKAGAHDELIGALHAARPQPLSKDQVLQLVAGGVASERATSLVKQRGIDFTADEQYLDMLRTAGADDALIAAVREARPVAPQTGTVRLNPTDGLMYVWIPPGTFMMGCSAGDSECTDFEKPAHQVTITRGFWIGETPVTVGAYKRFVGATVRKMPNAVPMNDGWVKEKVPITNVTWDEANSYCAWMGGRLPTEAEWEYAARGGSTEARYGPLDEIAWYNGNSTNLIHDVAQKRANGFGLYDMLGNVMEWVNDGWDKDTYRNGPSQDPQGSSDRVGAVQRGASYMSNSGNTRLSNRTWGFAANQNWFLGFRCSAEGAGP
jgi:formylglycine-generating enzyme required for sulfatase activity